MVTIHAISGRTITLGREGENLARQVVFDVSEWRASYGDGTVSLIAQRHRDTEPYPCNITVDGDTITWPITAADTAHPDYGRCELRYTVGDVLVKSETWRTYTADSLGTPLPEPPEPQQAWVDKVLEAGQAAVDASVNPPQIGENGNWFVWDFASGAYVDTGVAASGGGGGAVSSVNGKTGDVRLTAGDIDAIPSPATASVCQIVRVKAVDDTGKPTEWETFDGVQNVTMCGNSIVDAGVANIPRASSSEYGVIKPITVYGVEVNNNGALMATKRTSENYDSFPSAGFISKGTLENIINRLVKAAMCDGTGAAWTDAERIAALLRMGCTVDDNGFVKWAAQEATQ